ncbi:hypothetical protein [Streptomyces gibsoniae]|uniref:Uncharacterized protein n=1 Tax=Streptomyces gibsoniae TaxID=3075529 RepID=A0ABU2U7B0_9ACTN|nr:hypothetical protein [Streptomyces sp. DSM 41699]MDT0469118.1 hypothetical protein [Streptomyces sp. DSM 41699]
MPPRTALPPTAPDLPSYDLLAPQLSGGKDSGVMMAVFMESARASSVDDRVIPYHSSLGVQEWPPDSSAASGFPARAGHPVARRVPSGLRVASRRGGPPRGGV